MPYTDHWSRSHVERIMDISTTLSEFTQSFDLAKKIPAYLSSVLSIEPITLALIEQPRDADARVVLCASSGHVATGEAGATFHQHILQLHRQTRSLHAGETPALRLTDASGSSDAGSFELEVQGLPLFPRALVFARTLDESHRMCLIVHQQSGEPGCPDALIDTLSMIAGQLAKLLKCTIACADHPEILGGPFNRLTDREWMVLRGLNSEDGEKQLADRLSLSPHTLHSHIKSIYRKVGVQGRLPLLLRLHEAQRDLRMTTINARPAEIVFDHQHRATAVG